MKCVICYTSMLNGGNGLEEKKTDTRPHYLLSFCAMWIISAVRYLAVESTHRNVDSSVAPCA